MAERLLIGAYCLADYARSDEHVRGLKDAGIDFLCAVPADRALLDLCARYGIGVYASGVLPPWWGGKGENAGALARKVPLQLYDKAAQGFVPHPAIWGLDLGDEPSALDFEHYGRLVERFKQLFPGLTPYLNIYPNYAVVAATTDEERRAQLGAPDYAAYIDEYARLVDTDYICYDHYMYSATVAGAYENLRIVADKCRATGRELWVVLQVNSSRPDTWLELHHLRHQAFTALAFGAVRVTWACWTAGWWYNNVLDERGEPTMQYPRMCTVNRELHALGERYIRYINRDTHFVGFEPRQSLQGVGQQAERSFDAGAFRDVRIDEGRGAIAGHMTARQGDGEAIMIADACEPVDAYYVYFRAERGEPRALLNGLPTPVLRTGEHEYRARIEPCSGLFIELQ